MIDITIVCSHDAMKVAEMLTRLLEAEEHKVRLLVGRQSLSEVETSKSARDAVLLIWSANAPTQHYMREWSRQISPLRLVEIGLAPGWPDIARKAPVIDFINWRGERGARAWNALNDRLRAVARIIEPPKPPPKRAAIARSRLQPPMKKWMDTRRAFYSRATARTASPPTNKAKKPSHCSFRLARIGGSSKEPSSAQPTFSFIDRARGYFSSCRAAKISPPQD